MKIKQLVALLLSLCLAAAVAVPVWADEAGEPAPPCQCGDVLQVFVRGFLRALYFDYGTEKQKEAFLPLHLLMDERGQSILPITKTWVIDHDHTENPEYEFLYDYRLDAFETAAQLNDFIETLCKETGHEKIALTGMSQGTSIVMTYVAQYGTGRLETLILINGSYQGDILLGELLTNRWALSVPALINFIESLLPASPLVAAMMNVWRMLPLADLRTPASGDTAGPLGKLLYNWAITRLLGQMPAIWTFVPTPYREQARKLLDDDKYEYLRTRADLYYNEVQTQVPRLLSEAKEQGVKVAVIAAYGKAPIPLLDNSYYQGDLIIDTANESGGATTAPMGETLDPQGRDPRYLSPDGIIDASTCNLPDQTWFIKYNGHDFLPSEALRMWIIHYDTGEGGYPSIWENENFPQYLRLTTEGGTEPLDEQPADPPKTLSDAFARLVEAF